jgi:hypothetical protein
MPTKEIFAMKPRMFNGLGAVALALGIGTLAFNARSEERGFGPPFVHRASGDIDQNQR